MGSAGVVCGGYWEVLAGSGEFWWVVCSGAFWWVGKFWLVVVGSGGFW